MKHLSAVNKYFWKYKKRLVLGILFILLSNYFRILSPQVSGYVIDRVTQLIQQQNATAPVLTNLDGKSYNALIQYLIHSVQVYEVSFSSMVVFSGITLLVLALLGGLFMFLMRQTIIVMSRLIEFDQKNEVYNHYQQLDIGFYKVNSTGDLMNRIAEDISRVRMYTGPAIMYIINLSATIGFSVYFMWQQNAELTCYVLAPLPILALIIYVVNTKIHKKSTIIQGLLSDLTTTAQESYSGIRVIKSFVQEKAMLHYFEKNSEDYKKNALGLAKLEAFYFPTMALLIGISTLLTIAIGGWYHASNHSPAVTAGTITEFVIYVNMLTFPVSAIGWTASMIQRAAASQKRLNEFLETKPNIVNQQTTITDTSGDIVFSNVSFTYSNTGIEAIKNINLTIQKGTKLLIVGKTGSGKSTFAQLLLRFYDPTNGSITINNVALQQMDIQKLRHQISYIPQDIFLFSDTVANNINFGLTNKASHKEVEDAAKFASIHHEILNFENGYETMIGERGVTLSGGQKQRIAIARGLIKNPEIVVFDDCLSAVDANTENRIVNNLSNFLQNKTGIVITHRIFSALKFDAIIVLDEGKIVEQGTHESLIEKNGYYAELCKLQQAEKKDESPILVNTTL